MFQRILRHDIFILEFLLFLKYNYLSIYGNIIKIMMNFEKFIILTHISELNINSFIVDYILV